MNKLNRWIQYKDNYLPTWITQWLNISMWVSFDFLPWCYLTLWVCKSLPIRWVCTCQRFPHAPPVWLAGWAPEAFWRKSTLHHRREDKRNSKTIVLNDSWLEFFSRTFTKIWLCWIQSWGHTKRKKGKQTLRVLKKRMWKKESFCILRLHLPLWRTLLLALPCGKSEKGVFEAGQRPPNVWTIVWWVVARID